MLVYQRLLFLWPAKGHVFRENTGDTDYTDADASYCVLKVSSTWFLNSTQYQGSQDTLESLLLEAPCLARRHAIHRGHSIPTPQWQAPATWKT